MTSLTTEDLNLIATLIKIRTSPIIDLNFVEDDLNFAQLAKTSNSQPPALDAPSTSKQIKSKPLGFEGSQIDVQKEHPPQTISRVPSDPSSQNLRTQVRISTPLCRAIRFQHSLGVKLPSCIKRIRASQITGFWLGFTLWFCKFYLPKEDTTFVLEEDETGQQSEVKYIADKRRLSAGWKSFVLLHNLIEGDILVLHLVEKKKFKVYIFKANNDSSEAGHTLSLMNLEAHTEQTTPVNNSEECGREVLERSEPSKTNPLQDVKSFLDFPIMFKGLCIDHELSEDVRVCYYKLCIYKKQWLHNGVSRDFCGVVVARMIGETVRIASEIKNCTMSTSKEDFGSWDKSLSSFEKFGMNVGFLRHKIHMLETLMFQSEGAVDVKRYEEAKEEHKRVKDEIKIVSAELTQLKKTANAFEEVTSGLKQKIEEFENKFQEEIDAL